MLPIHGQFKLPSEASNNSPLTEVFTDYFALDGMLWPPKYDPTPTAIMPQSSFLVTIQNIV